MAANPTNQRIVEQLLRALPDDPRAFAALSASITDWTAVVESARDQGVLGVLLHYWDDTDTPLPPGPSSIARRHRAVEQLWLEQVRAAADEALGSLQSSGLRCAALKGPVLAERLYPAADVRPCIDLDLLVAANDLEAAGAALGALGYRGEQGAGADYARRHKHHLHFRRAGMPDIELHFRLYAGFGTVLDAADALSRSSPFRTSSGASVRVLRPEDEVLYLALHAAGHSYVRVLWLYDLKLLLRASPRIDWTAVETRARSHGVRKVLAFTLRLLVDRLGTVLPDDALQAAASIRGTRLASRLLPVVMQPTVRSARENLESLFFTSLLCDRWQTGLGLIRHHAARSVRRRIHRLAPRMVPDAWSG